MATLITPLDGPSICPSLPIYFAITEVVSTVTLPLVVATLTVEVL
jgi:hypothetical protein